MAQALIDYSVNISQNNEDTHPIHRGKLSGSVTFNDGTHGKVEIDDTLNVREAMAKAASDVLAKAAAEAGAAVTAAATKEQARVDELAKRETDLTAKEAAEAAA